MDRLKFDECQKCKDWNGTMTRCFHICSNPIKALKEFNKYKDLDEQGKLLKLPCALGDTVYSIAGDCNGDVIDCRSQNCEKCGDFYKFVEENKFDAYMLNEIGKTLFLTRQEAEQALQKMNEIRDRNN